MRFTEEELAQFRDLGLTSRHISRIGRLADEPVPYESLRPYAPNFRPAGTFVDFLPGDIVQIVQPARYNGVPYDHMGEFGEVYVVEDARDSERTFAIPHVPVAGNWTEEACLQLVYRSPVNKILTRIEQAAERQALESLGADVPAHLGELW